MHNGHFLLGKSDFFYCPKLENSARISVMFDTKTAVTVFKTFFADKNVL